MALGDVGGVGFHSLIADRELLVLQQLKDAVFERVADERRHLVQPLGAKLNKRQARARALWHHRAMRQARARALWHHTAMRQTRARALRSKRAMRQTRVRALRMKGKYIE